MNELKNQTSLDASQTTAAAHVLGPAAVIAGPGAGKTRLIVEATANKVEAGFAADTIMVLSFSVEAVNTLRFRLGERIGSQAAQVWMATFHSAAKQILENYPEVCGLAPDWAITDAQDLALKVAHDFGLDAKEFAVALSKQRNTGLDVPERFGLALAEFELRLAEAGLVDLAGLVLKALRAMQAVPELLMRVRERARFVVVDEAQDCSPVQAQFADLIAGAGGNLVVVGDPNQSIHDWRQACPKFLSDFAVTHLGAAVFGLNMNYRSGSLLVALANRFMGTNHLAWVDSDFGIAKMVVVEDELSWLASQELGEGDAILVRDREGLRDLEARVLLGGRDVRLRAGSLRYGRIARLFVGMCRLQLCLLDFDAEKLVLQSLKLQADHFIGHVVGEALSVWLVEMRDRAEDRAFVFLESLFEFVHGLEGVNFSDRMCADVTRVLAAVRAENLSVADFALNFSQVGKVGVALVGMHQSKGLEWDRVFVVPRVGELDEAERRLVYVAMTRARKSLVVVTRDREGAVARFMAAVSRNVSTSVTT